MLLFIQVGVGKNNFWTLTVKRLLFQQRVSGTLYIILSVLLHLFHCKVSVLFHRGSCR